MKRFNWKKVAAVIFLLIGFVGALTLNPAFNGPEADLLVKILWYVSLIVILGGVKLAGGWDWILGNGTQTASPRKYSVIYPADYHK